MCRQKEAVTTRKNEDTAISQQGIDRNKLIEGAFKTIIHDRSILAFIVKNTVKECMDADLETIRDGIAHVEGSNLAKGREQDLQVYPSRIELDSSFDLTIEGTEISIIINIEAQNHYNPGYPLENRATFYASCVLASQKGNEMLNDRYDQLRPVYSIWVLPNPPEELRNIVETYSITETTEGGGRGIKSLINIVFLNIGYYDKGSNPAVDLFSILMRRYDGATDKISDMKKKLRECLKISVSDDVLGGANAMMTLAEQSELLGYKAGYGDGYKDAETKITESVLMAEAESTVENIFLMCDKRGMSLEEVLECIKVRDDLRPYFDKVMDRYLAERGMH